jgi:hypothetical protein
MPKSKLASPTPMKMASVWTSLTLLNSKDSIKFVCLFKEPSPPSTKCQNMTAQTSSTINPLVNTKSPLWLMHALSQIAETLFTITN